MMCVCVYALDFSSARLLRFRSLSALVGEYTTRLDACDCHVKVSMFYLIEADLLMEHKKEITLDAGSVRLSFCHTNNDDLFAKAA